MKINMPFFYKKPSLVIKREQLYLGALYNNDFGITERKILCVKRFDGVKDVLFKSPNYTIDGTSGYTVERLVQLDQFLQHLGYSERLNAKDLRKIYRQVLSSTKTLHKHCDLFGIVKVRSGRKGEYSYWPYYQKSDIMDYEDFYNLKELISFPIKPSDLEKQNDQYSFQKRLIFIP